MKSGSLIQTLPEIPEPGPISNYDLVGLGGRIRPNLESTGANKDYQAFHMLIWNALRFLCGSDTALVRGKGEDIYGFPKCEELQLYYELRKEASHLGPARLAALQKEVGGQ